MASPESASVILDCRLLEELVGDDPSVVSSFLQQFIASATTELLCLQDAFNSRNVTALESLAHKLKSTARSVGAAQLADLCQDIEKAASRGDWEQLGACRGAVGPAFHAVTEAVSAHEGR